MNKQIKHLNYLMVLLDHRLMILDDFIWFFSSIFFSFFRNIGIEYVIQFLLRH